MKDDARSASTLIVVILGIIVAGALSAVLILSPAPAPSLSKSSLKSISGTVVSSGAINLGKYSGGTREMALVRLPNGSTVSALVASGGPLSPGDRVTLEPALTGAIWPSHNALSPPYEIVAKLPR